MEAKVQCPNGKFLTAKILVDNTSESTFVLDSFAKKAGLKLGRKISSTVVGIGGKESKVQVSPVHLELHPTWSDTEVILLKAYTLPSIMGPLEKIDWDIEKQRFDHLKDLSLTCVGKGDSPDILIGTDHPWVHVALETRTGRKEDPYAERTGLGWLVRGCLSSVKPKKKIIAHTVQTSFKNLAEKFFDGERFGTEHSSVRLMTPEDAKVLSEVNESTFKLPDEPGYCVKLPWRTDVPPLENNRKIAEKCLNNTLAKLSKSEKDHKDYSAAIEKYVTEGYVSVVYSYNLGERSVYHEQEGQYFLPHHGVRKKASSKMRIVFDSAATSFNGLCLNDHLWVGPKLQVEIPDVLTRFRESPVAFIADIEAMFSRISLTEEDARKHQFLWKFPGQSAITVLRMNRVAFGDGPSPFLAINTLHRTANDFGSKDPEAVEVIKNGFFVDDLVDSAVDVETANRRVLSITEILKNGDFHLRSWRSNHEGFVMPQEEVENSTVRVLGTLWDTEKDTLSHVIPDVLAPDQMLTKRKLLSLVASLYSPLGLVAPFVVMAKIRLKKLHLMGLDWDSDVAATTGGREEVTWWKEWSSLLPEICKIQFPRCLCPNDLFEIEIHAFGDASEEAFAACVYLRCVSIESVVTVNLVTAKTRVAPRKVISVAKLELQAALLAARSCHTVENSIRFKINRRVFWTDSTCVRHWVRSVGTFYKAFVANRIGEIQELTEPHEWRHLPGKLNPADLATRSDFGEPGSDRIPNHWIQGPEFLYEEEEKWPKDLAFERILLEIRPRWEFPEETLAQNCGTLTSLGVSTKRGISSTTTANEQSKGKSLYSFTAFPVLASGVESWRKNEDELIDLKRFSSFKRLKHSLAYSILWSDRIRARVRHEEMPTLREDHLERALHILVRIAQKEGFKKEIEALAVEEELKGSRLAPFSPFIDEHDLLRVGGRVGRSSLPYDAAHPLLLPREHHLSLLIARHYHQRYFHAGVNYVLAHIRQQFWILSGRELVKKVVRDCRECTTASVKPSQQIMAELPPERLLPTPPFTHTSVDYFGPMTVGVGYRKTDQRWGALFTCMTTRAVHLEVAASLSTPDFLNLFRIFCCLRGTPKTCYSDNGTQFKGAEKWLRHVYESLSSDAEFKEEMVKRGIKWTFYPPHAPHFGGVHESLVRSVKRAFYKALDISQKRKVENKTQMSLKECELRLLFAEVTGFLNARPLSYTSGDPKDGVLTPNHFLLLRVNSEIPPKVYDAASHKDNYQRMQNVVNKIWEFWLKEFLPTMISRAKWRKTERNHAVGDLVLVLEDNLPRNKWKMGRISRVYPDKKEMVRSADVEIYVGDRLKEYHKPIVKLCLLEAITPNAFSSVFCQYSSSQ